MDLLMTGWEFFLKGGPVMYVLLLCSIFVVTIAIERWGYFRQEDAGRDFAIQYADKILQGDVSGAEIMASQSKGILPRLLHQALTENYTKGLTLTAFFEVQSGIAISRFRKRLYYLSVIVTLGPLLGLLGTISGIIGAFSIFNLESGQAMAITGGVGEALIATAMGLCTAIIALMVHAYFVQRIDSIVGDMEQCFSLTEGIVKERD